MTTEREREIERLFGLIVGNGFEKKKTGNAIGCGHVYIL